MNISLKGYYVISTTKNGLNGKCSHTYGGDPSSCFARLSDLDGVDRYPSGCEKICTSDEFCFGYQVSQSGHVDCYLFKNANICPHGFRWLKRDHVVVGSNQLKPAKFASMDKYSVCYGKKTGNVHRLRILVFYQRSIFMLIDKVIKWILIVKCYFRVWIATLVSLEGQIIFEQLPLELKIVHMENCVM